MEQKIETKSAKQEENPENPAFLMPTDWPEILPHNAVVMDNESTGLDPKKNSLFEVAWVGRSPIPRPQYRKDYSVVCDSSKFRPRVGTALTSAAQDVHGLTWPDFEALEMSWTKGLESVFSTLEAHRERLGVRKLIIAGHNPAKVELLALQAAWDLLGRPPRFFPFSHRTIDLHSAWASACVVSNHELPESGAYADEIYRAVAMPTEPNPHQARNGALWELEAFRRITEILQGGNKPSPVVNQPRPA